MGSIRSIHVFTGMEHSLVHGIFIMLGSANQTKDTSLNLQNGISSVYISPVLCNIVADFCCFVDLGREAAEAVSTSI